MLKSILIFMLVLIGWGLSQPLQARDNFNCWLLAGAEFLIPGMGYAIMQDWDKMVFLGGARWASGMAYVQYASHDDYQEDSDDIYVETGEGDDEELHIFLNKETFLANTNASIYSNLTYATMYDLYDGGCENNPDTYYNFLAPIRFDKHFDSIQFWAPLAVLGGSLDTDTNTTYHVEKGLTRSEMQRYGFLQYYLVGVGEEMLFRGVIQRSLYYWLKDSYSRTASRWGAIVGASTIFGLAHSGEGLTAGPGAAFLAGLYLGWVYQDENEQFDLDKAIAIHSWWDVGITYHNLAHSDFEELDQDQTLEEQREEVKNQRVIPLFYYQTQF